VAAGEEVPARTPPIYGEMRHWLAMQKEERDRKRPACPLVFHYLGRPIESHIKGWKEACRRVGVPGLLFQDLRRSAVRNMERAGFPRKLAMSISGHKTEAVYRRCDIVSPEDLKIARAKMERYVEQQQAETAVGGLQTCSYPIPGQAGVYQLNSSGSLSHWPRLLSWRELCAPPAS